METKTILIVDDEPDNLTMFSQVLSREQFSVITASGGAECLNIAHDTVPDLVLLDVNMPDMDGFETIKKLRSIKRLSFTPIVFLTGFGKTPKAIDQGYSLGGNEYWTKPIAPEELVVRVRAVLRTADAEKRLRKLQQGFYSMVVHDLRNPIGAILGYSDFLLDDKDSMNTNQMEIVQEINVASQLLLKSVKDLLELSQFESGEYTVRREPVDLARMVQSVIAASAIARNQKQIDVQSTIEQELQPCVDPEYFREVLDNLYDNALRYTPANGVITFTAKRIPRGESNAAEVIVMEIADTGCGISPDTIPSLFDKNRITNIKLRKAGSRTGLGLVICREIIEAHEGTISIESKSGTGTTVTIVLPG
jgi:two-component system, sensor histidine kinase and response regulator